MRSPPGDLSMERLQDELYAGWGLLVDSMKYLPEGGGSHHWKATDTDRRPHFVTVDDLDNKDWMADTREATFSGLSRAVATAHALRSAGLSFVVAPLPGVKGELLRRVDDRHTVAVLPFLRGRPYPFGPYADAELRDRALDMVIALHQSTPSVRDQAPVHALRFGGRDALDAFLSDPATTWSGGPFSDGAHRLMTPHAPALARLVEGFDRLADLTAQARSETVITHGEPHPANLMSVGNDLMLIDWDTVALGPPERDLSVIAADDGDAVDRYERATGRTINPSVTKLYRLRWYLDDIASAVRLFRNRHGDTADTRRWRDGLGLTLELLPVWLERVDTYP